MRRSWDKTNLFLTLAQVISVVTAVVFLFLMLDGHQAQFLVQHGQCLVKSGIDESTLSWGMSFFLVSLALGLLFIVAMFFISFKDD